MNNPSPAPSAAPLDQLERSAYGGFWRRVVASLVDAAMVAGASLGFIVASMWLGGHGVSGDAVAMKLENLGGLANLYFFIVGLAYAAFFEASAHQATPGKQLLSLHVADEEGRRLTFNRALGRHLAKIVSNLTLLIGYLMVAFTGRRQGLHDKIARTVVLRGRRVAGDGAAPETP